jgi:adenylate cyclase
LTRDHRRLAAIVSADVVGYSLLMGRDDSATLVGLKAHRRELIDPKIAEYGGRIVKTTGDGLLLEFPSVVDAVRCAVDVQRGMAERNVGVPPEQRIEFRIGINVGDIIIDGDDIFGDGVNVAARLQTLAEPGGICVSRVVRDQVLDKLSFAFEDLGAQEVKNIARPVEVYRVDLGTEALPTPGRSRRRWQRLTRGPRRWFVTGVVAFGLAGIAVWTMPQLWKTAAPAPTPPHFSVAILPFAAPAGSPADEQFAEALTNDLTMGIGRAHLGPVVSHSLAVTYKSKAIDARAIGRELNVRYLVQGEVRRAGERITVNAQLIDAGNATQLWSDQLEVDRVQATQDASGLAALLNIRVRNALYGDESRRASAPLPPGASAMDLALHADAVYGNRSCTVVADCVLTMLEARKMYDQALRLDPNLVYAMNGRADTLNNQFLMDLHADHDRVVQELDEVSNRAIATDPNDPYAWFFRVMALSSQWRWPAALEATTKMSSLDPTDKWSFLLHGRIMFFTGQPGEALAWIDKPLALDPQFTRNALLLRCRASQALGRYDDAIAACEKSVAERDNWLDHAYLAAAYAQKGESAKAEAEKTNLLRYQPGITIAELKAQRLSNDPAYLQQTETHLYAGLRKAGIPEK